MRWTPKDKSEKYRKWHQWFAWHPVKLNRKDGMTIEIIWLETILRKEVGSMEYNIIDRMFFMPQYEYRECIFDLLKDPE